MGVLSGRSSSAVRTHIHTYISACLHGIYIWHTFILWVVKSCAAQWGGVVVEFD